jgi:hypothetical protein
MDANTAHSFLPSFVILINTKNAELREMYRKCSFIPKDAGKCT